MQKPGRRKTRSETRFLTHFLSHHQQIEKPKKILVKKCEICYFSPKITQSADHNKTRKVFIQHPTSSIFKPPKQHR